MTDNVYSAILVKTILWYYVMIGTSNDRTSNYRSMIFNSYSCRNWAPYFSCKWIASDYFRFQLRSSHFYRIALSQCFLLVRAFDRQTNPIIDWYYYRTNRRRYLSPGVSHYIDSFSNERMQKRVWKRCKIKKKRRKKEIRGIVTGFCTGNCTWAVYNQPQFD